jgi:tetratricopeptide (TPR) repeat protein
MIKQDRLLIVFLLLLFTAEFPLIAQSTSGAGELLAKAETSFKEGNELMQSVPELSKERYSAAVGYYNSIIDSGIRNAGLYYNLANAYFRLDKTGLSVLNYRRALLYSPGDKQIQYNLEYVRTKQKNGFTVQTEHEIFQILFFWHYWIPLRIKAVLFIIANTLFWGALVLNRFGRPLFWLIAVPLVAGIFLSGSLFLDWKSSKVVHGVVTRDSTIGRMGDSRSYESSFDAPLYQGVEFEIEQQRVGWILAELPNGELTWLEEKDCAIIED